MSAFIAGPENDFILLLLFTLHAQGKVWSLLDLIASKSADRNMFTAPKAAITFSILITIVSSISRPSAEDFDPDFNEALYTDMFLDELSNSDDLMASAGLTDMFEDLTLDANFLGDEENLFAADTRPGNSCSAEDIPSLTLIGKLRSREESQSGSADGNFCVPPTQESTGETLDPFLPQLPMVDQVVKPTLESRRDICPAWRFGRRDIPLCSLAEPQIISNEVISLIVIRDANICMLSPSPRRLSTDGCGGLALHDLPDSANICPYMRAHRLMRS